MIKVVNFTTLIFKKWLKDNNIEMYSTHNEGKNMYIYVLNDFVDQYNNTYHKTIKMKPVDVKSDSFAEYNEESNEKILNLK